MVIPIHIRYPGWIRTAVTISRQGPKWNPRTSTISKGESPGAPDSSEWAPIIWATGSRSARPRPTTDSCRENTLRGARLRQVHLLIYDSPCFRGRLLLQTKFTISILQLHLPDCIGWSQSLKVDL